MLGKFKHPKKSTPSGPREASKPAEPAYVSSIDSQAKED